MQTPDTLVNLMKHASLAVELVQLPVARLCFERHLNPAATEQAWTEFTRPHPRYKLVGNKALGVALVDIAGFGNAASYLDTVRQRGHAGPQSRKAAARGYVVRRIERDAYLADIHALHTACAGQQGAAQEQAAPVPQPDGLDTQSACHGVFDADGRLAAYCQTASFGNFAATGRLMGYRKGDGAMYLLLSSIICELIEDRRVAWFMFGNYVDVRPGLRDFKRRLGFHPYRVRYAIV